MCWALMCCSSSIGPNGRFIGASTVQQTRNSLSRYGGMKRIAQPVPNVLQQTSMLCLIMKSKPSPNWRSQRWGSTCQFWSSLKGLLCTYGRIIRRRWLTSCSDRSSTAPYSATTRNFQNICWCTFSKKLWNSLCCSTKCMA